MFDYVAVRAPLRVSFFGGGTDYPEYFRDHPAAVLGMAINRYIYVGALKRPSFARHEFTIAYSKLEKVIGVDDIQHPAIRAGLQEFGFEQPIDVSTFADLPAQTGLGSSGSFMVAFIRALAAFTGHSMTKAEMAMLAVEIERDRLKHTCGVQDQLHAAYGGFHYFDLSHGKMEAEAMMLGEAKQRRFLDSLVLVFTKQTRSAPAVLKEQVAATEEKKITADLSRYYDMALQAKKMLQSESDPIKNFGALMHEGWLTKQRFASSISNPAIDELYAYGIQNGAYGGKLCGAGGGGFILFVVPPEARSRFIAKFEPDHALAVDMDPHGVTLLSSSAPEPGKRQAA